MKKDTFKEGKNFSPLAVFTKSVIAKSVLFFTFLVRFVLFFLLRHCVHSQGTDARTQARVNHCTIYPGSKDENTVYTSLYLGSLLGVPFSRDVGGFRSNKICRSNPQ